VRQLIIFFVVGSVLLTGKRVLLAKPRPEPLTVRIAAHDSSDTLGAIDRALLADSALSAGAELMDPVIRERLLTLLADPHGPTPSDRALLQTARELDLFHRDLLLETRLAANGELRIKASLALPSAGDAELQAYLDAHRERYQRSERFSFAQLFLARSAHGDPLAAAQQLREQLIAQHVSADRSSRYGNPCNLPQRVEQSSLLSITTRFGSAIAEALPRLEKGVWSQPLTSSLGAHLIWITDHQPAQPAALADVRDRVRADFAEQAREAAFQDRMAALRSERAIQRVPTKEHAANGPVP
jgi:hypothetical protein